MSPLRRYLALSRDARTSPGYVLEWRHGEGGPWLPLANAASLEDVASELASPAVALALGDLVRVLDPQGTVVDFAVMTDEALRGLPSGRDRSLSAVMFNRDMEDWFLECGYDWEHAWEKCPRADWMLLLANLTGGPRGVGRKTMVLAVCDCAETALRYVPAGEDRPRVAIETTRRWARGETSPEEAERAGEAAQDAAQTALGSSAPAACASAANAALAVWSCDRGASSIALAFLASARAMPGARAPDALWAPLTALVRQRIPLWQLALGLATRLSR